MAVTPMKKVTVAGVRRDEYAIVAAIQDAGLLHLTKLPAPENQTTLQELQQAEANLKQSIENSCKAKKVLVSNDASQGIKPNSLKDIADIIAYILEKERICEAKHALKKQTISHIELLQSWGNFNLAHLEGLRRNGVHIICAEIDSKNWEKIKAQDIPHVICKRTKNTLWVALAHNAESIPEVEPIHFPKMSLRFYQSEKLALNSELEALESDIACFKHCVRSIDRQIEKGRDELALLQARQSLYREEQFFMVQGFLPARLERMFRSKLVDQVTAFKIESPTQDDEVPVQLENGPLFRGFESVVKSFSGISYHEKDFTWSVAILFMLYASLCLVDAGYGLLLSCTGLLLRQKKMAAMGQVFVMAGLVSMLVGAISGQLFGFVVGVDFFMGLKPPLPLATDPLFCFKFSLGIGVAAMAFSYASGIWQNGLKTHLTGSLVLVASVVTLVLSKQLPAEGAPFMEAMGLGGIGLSLLCWVIFPEPIFGDARVANIIWTLYSGFTGLVQDVLSHMRLFGIALSGAILALVVNRIGGMMPFYIGIPFSIFGHLFVYLLALLSLYVHSNRLIFLEFGSKCFKGGHHFYQPLKRSVQT